MANPLRMLIVEDSESDAALVVRLFSKAGYQVTSHRVETRDALLAALTPDTWDCIIADQNMPEFDAFAALETLRSTGLDIPFIVVSGSIGEEAAVALMKAGAADYVMKGKLARLIAVLECELRDAATRRERTQAVEDLRASEEKYRRLYDLESDALFLIERDSGRIVEANAGATSLYGYSHDEWLTMRNVDVSTEPDHTTAATHTGVTDIPVRWHRKKDGTVFPVDIRATHFEWQGRAVHLAAIRDITERVRAQEALRTERDRAQSYLQIAGVVLLALDLQGKITLINRRGCELLGYTEEELLGKDWFDTCIPPADREALRGALSRIFADDDPRFTELLNPILSKSGELRLISWHNSILRGADGKPLGILTSGEDITERRQAEESLRESEQRLRDIIFSMADWVWEVDAQGRYTYSSQNGSEMFGPADEYVIGKTPFDLMPPDEAKRVEAIFSEIAANKAPIKDLENWNIGKDGELYCMLTSGVPILDEDGRLTGYRGVDKDITERKLAEEQLKRSEANLQQAQHVARVGSWSWDIKTGHVTWSNEMYRIFGLTEENFTGSLSEVIASAIHPEDQAKVEASNLAVAQQGRPEPMEYRVLWPDGSVRVVWAEAGELTRDEAGNPAMLTGIVHDITDRKRIEEALRDSNTLLQRTLAGLDEAVFVVNVATREILMCSPAVERIFGYSPEEMVGGSSRQLHVSQESFENFVKQRIALTGPDAMARLEYQMRRKDGTVFWSENTVAELKGDPSGSTMVVSVVRDISERKQADDVIRASLREKEILLREIHHRVKNNLQVIASLLTLQAQSVSDPSALEVLKDSQNRIRAMSLIHAKLYESTDLAKVDFGAFVRDLGTILLRAFAVDPSAIRLKVSAGQAELGVDTLVPCSLIVNELLANAVKHAFPSGGGAITVEFSEQEDGYILRVADDGIGFPDTVDFRNTKSLGLRLVNMLVEQLEGTIDMVSRNGTAFTIRFQRDASG